jgi:tRNA(Ile)-lysidine synthase
MRRELEALIRAEGVLVPGRPVLVLLSGGRDSVCLLDAAVRVSGDVRALHVDYGLRPGAAGDAAFCADLCQRLGVALQTVAAGPPPATGNLQAWARDLRYGAAEAAFDGDVATGHTRSDQVETILYRLAAAPSRRALLGMAPRSGRRVRPLLSLTREQTAGWCREAGLAYRDDPTNDDPRFARNRVRAGLLPALREVHPAAEANVARVAEVLRVEAAVLDGLVDETIAAEPLTLARLRALPLALARLVVVRLAEDATGAPAPRAAARTEEILALDDTRAWTALDIGDGVRAVVEQGVLQLRRRWG